MGAADGVEQVQALQLGGVVLVLELVGRHALGRESNPGVKVGVEAGLDGEIVIMQGVVALAVEEEPVLDQEEEVEVDEEDQCKANRRNIPYDITKR